MFLIGLNKFEEAQQFEDIFTSFKEKNYLAGWEIASFKENKEEVYRYVNYLKN